MTPEDFDILRTLAAEKAGFELSPDRAQLVEHRLGPVARRAGLATVAALIAAMREQPHGSLAWAGIEAVLNAETWFRRDRAPFATYAREVLPAIARARPEGRVRVWSAGCSTGQEAWSLAMEPGAARLEILATDLSSRAIEKAASRLYTPFEVQRGLSARRMLECFEQTGDAWRVRDEVAAPVRLERHNILDGPPEAARFDVIFCRYVLEDMAPARRATALRALADAMVDDGCLFVGLKETLEDGEAFRPVAGRKGLFVKAPGALRRAA